MNPVSIERLQAFRDDFGLPFSMVKGGGYRCLQYLKGNKTSAHGLGQGFDPDFGSEHYYRALGLAIKHGFTGIGLKQKGGRFQFHMDDAPAIPGVRPRPWFWTY